MQDQKRRRSVATKAKPIEEILDKFTSKEFLTKNSLFNNLLSSQDLKIDLSSNERLKTIFGTKQIGERDLHEFAYFHMREKKIIIFNYLLHFLESVPKTQLVLMLNSERFDLMELKQYLTAQENGGKVQLWDEFKKRVHVFAIDNANKFVFNLLNLALMVRENQFLRAVIICDINAFESSDKSSLDKYYRKIPKEMTVLAFRKDFFQYRVIIKTALSYITEGEQQITQINQKVIRYLNRKLQQFNYHFHLIVPYQNVFSTAKSVEETYKSVVFRLGHTNRIQEVTFNSKPFKLESVRQL